MQTAVLLVFRRTDGPSLVVCPLTGRVVDSHADCLGDSRVFREPAATSQHQKAGQTPDNDTIVEGFGSLQGQEFQGR